MFTPQLFNLLKKSQVDDGIGGFKEGWALGASISGYLDLITGTNESNVQNASIESSTHILIIPNIPNGLEITDQMRISDGEGRWYVVTYVDDPLGQHHHLEIYLTYGGVSDGL